MRRGWRDGGRDRLADRERRTTASWRGTSRTRPPRLNHRLASPHTRQHRSNFYGSASTLHRRPRTSSSRSVLETIRSQTPNTRHDQGVHDLHEPGDRGSHDTDGSHRYDIHRHLDHVARDYIHSDLDHLRRDTIHRHLDHLRRDSIRSHLDHLPPEHVDGPYVHRQLDDLARYHIDQQLGRPRALLTGSFDLSRQAGVCDTIAVRS